MRFKVLVSLGFLALLSIVATSTNRSTSAQDTQPDVMATVTALENRVLGLEARVSLLEHGDASTAPTSQTTTGPVHRFTGTLSIFLALGHGTPEGVDCSGKDSTSSKTDYKGVKAGSRITVKDDKGNVVGLGSLGQGKVAHKETPATAKPPKTAYSACEFPLLFKDIPDSSFYTIVISGFSGELTISRDELEANNWVLDLG